MTRPLLTYLTRGFLTEALPLSLCICCVSRPKSRERADSSLYNQPAHASDKLRGLKWESKEWNWERLRAGALPVWTGVGELSSPVIQRLVPLISSNRFRAQRRK